MQVTQSGMGCSFRTVAGLTAWDGKTKEMVENFTKTLPVERGAAIAVARTDTQKPAIEAMKKNGWFILAHFASSHGGDQTPLAILCYGKSVKPVEGKIEVVRVKKVKTKPRIKVVYRTKIVTKIVKVRAKKAKVARARRR